MILIFDGDCGFCTTTAGWIERRLPEPVRVSPWQILDLEELGLTENDVTTAAYWIDGEGRAHRGHLAIGRSLVAAGGFWRLVGHLLLRPPVSWLARPVYSWVAANRHRLPGATDACRVDLAAMPDDPTGSGD